MSLSVSFYPVSNLSPRVSKSLISLCKSKISSLEHLISNPLSAFKSIISSVLSALISIFQSVHLYFKNFLVADDFQAPFGFYFNEHIKSFTKINLENLKIQPVATPMEFLISFKSGARISQRQYFLHGGCKNYEASHETCLYDIYSNSLVILPKSNFSKNGGACVHVKNRVFAFSSTYPISRKCEVFDLSQRTWKKINDVPYEVRFMTATGWIDEIYLTGAGVFGFLAYDIQSDSFTLTSGLSGGYKILLSNYILSNEGLFEIQKEGLKKYSAEWVCSPLQISIPFRYKRKIYFIDCYKKICRLDLSSKKIEKLN